MSVFSFSHFSSCYLCLIFFLALFQLCLSNQVFNDVLCIKEERHALLQFKYHLIDEGGRLASWVDEETDCCKWVGIACNNMTGHVHQIHLRALGGHCGFVGDAEKEALKQQLKGELSPSLLDLKQLKHLDLSCNDFGLIQVPEFVGSLGRLRYLNLSRSNFSGTIPPQLGNISELHTLCIGSFQEDGVEHTNVVNMEWLSNLHLLRYLDMSNVDLRKATDWFQVINTLPFLAELHLHNSFVSDFHPHVPSLNTTSLLFLDLFGNYVTNSLAPQWIFSITSLVSLDLSYCGFSSSSSAHSFRNLTSLKWLHVPLNTFMNSPLVLKELSSGIGSNIISLDISFCHISSTALDSLNNLTSLVSLDLSKNQLTNIIPKSLGNFCNLRDIDLSFNNFQNISLAYLLETLLECKSPHLESLIISDNSGLCGTIPYSIGRLSMLETLYISHNQLNGSLPNSLGQLSKLEELVFSSNFLTCIVTETHFVKLVHLKYLFGSGNNLTLRPRISSWIPPFQLKMLYLNSWNLGPQFPSWLLSQRELIELGISNTNIFSRIPESFWRSFPNLEYLDMSKNQMQGMVNLSGFPALVSLYLSSNRFRGELPDIFNGSRLVFLDLSNNLFVGSLHHLLCSDGVKSTRLLGLIGYKSGGSRTYELHGAWVNF